MHSPVACDYPYTAWARIEVIDKTPVFQAIARHTYGWALSMHFVVLGVFSACARSFTIEEQFFGFALTLIGMRGVIAAVVYLLQSILTAG